MKRRVVLVDDEINALKMLELELRRFEDQFDIIGRFQNPIEALAFINKEEVDILFVDVEMPQMSGLDLIKSVQKKSLQVIVTTAYSQYAINALKASAIDYLLKPIDSEELDEAAKKALENLRKESANPLNTILQKLDQYNHNVIKIPTTYGYAFIDFDEIVYCKSESNYTNIVTSKKTILVSKTLKFIQDLLPDDRFLRVHNSYVVNLSHIKEYSRKDGGFVMVSNGEKIKVSSSKKDLFLNG